MNKNTDNFLSPHSLVHAHTHTNKHRSHLPRMCAGTCDQVIINFSPLPRLLVSLTDATLISVCINTLRHHLHCGCEYCCSKKKEKKKQGQREKKEVSRLSETPFMATFFFSHVLARSPLCKRFQEIYAVRPTVLHCGTFHFFSFKKSFKNKKKGIIETMNNEQ